MPTLAEFTLTLLLRRIDGEPTLHTVLRFSTVREFRSFRYAISLEDSFDREARTITVKLLGMQAPTNVMPAPGAAVSELSYPDLAGSYDVTLIGAKRTTSLSFTVDTDRIAVTRPPENFVVNAQKGVEIVRP